LSLIPSKYAFLCIDDLSISIEPYTLCYPESIVADCLPIAMG
jgi:hypothetical protein